MVSEKTWLQSEMLNDIEDPDVREYWAIVLDRMRESERKLTEALGLLVSGKSQPRTEVVIASLREQLAQAERKLDEARQEAADLRRDADRAYDALSDGDGMPAMGGDLYHRVAFALSVLRGASLTHASREREGGDDG